MKHVLTLWPFATMRIGPIVATCALVLAQWSLCMNAAAQSTSAEMQSLRQEIESLRAAEAATRAELQEIKARLRQLSAPAPSAGPSAGTELSLQGAQIRGARDAKVILVEFSDFQCPFCARYATSTYAEIVRDYVDTGRVRYAFMNSPIDSLHPAAFKQHLAAACAADEGRFWEMHDRLFVNPKATDVETLAGQAAAIGIDTASFRACMDRERHADEVRETVKLGNAIGVNGTPTFLIGTIGPDDKFKTLKMIAGAKPYAAFKDAIDGVLTATARSGPSLAVQREVSSGWHAAETGWRAAEGRN